MALRRGLAAALDLLLPACAGLLSACAGPGTILRAPELTLIDGVLAPKADPTGARQLPFRYYGTTQVDAFPGAPEDSSPADFDTAPARVTATRAEPITPWVFPFDLPLELIRWTLLGQVDQQIAIELPASSTPVAQGYRPPDLVPLRHRALAARIQR